MHGERYGQCEECGTRLYQAGDHAPAGEYLRIDDGSFQRLNLSADGALPATFDGRIALYRAAAAPCVCERRQRGAIVADHLSESHVLDRLPHE